ncbi:hypothetical protein ACHAXA_004265 [Cyclostephanos tholiformis]|uniref:Uncharacterized protein n=1 Tax=Cyclostephanos tholiformis TaxID=382380 RepID=A0ABD3RG48_9STRA
MHPYTSDDDDVYDHAAAAALDGDAVTEWIRDALREYEQVAALCNSQLMLANAVVAANPSSSTSVPNRIDDNEDDWGNYANPRTLSMELRRLEVSEYLANYHLAIDDVRRTHASLKARVSPCARRRNRRDDDDDDDDGGVGDDRLFRRRSRRPTTMATNVAFEFHVELAERVIRTATRSSTGMCGILHENGIVDLPSDVDRESYIVALASLRASISRLAAEFGGEGEGGGGGGVGVALFDSMRDVIAKGEGGW